MPRRSRLPRAVSLAALGLSLALSSGCATSRLWQGDVAGNEDFDTRAEEFRPVSARGIRLEDERLVLWIDAGEIAQALAGWCPPGEVVLLELQPAYNSPLVALFPDLPLLDTTTLELRVIGKDAPAQDAASLAVRARCRMSGNARDPRFIERLEEQRARFHGEAWLEAPGPLAPKITVSLERPSVFDPAAWAVSEVLAGEIVALESTSVVPSTRLGLELQLVMAPVAPPDPPLMLLVKVLATPLTLAVDVISIVGLLGLSSGMAAPAG